MRKHWLGVTIAKSRRNSLDRDRLDRNFGLSCLGCLGPFDEVVCDIWFRDEEMNGVKKYGEMDEYL